MCTSKDNGNCHTPAKISFYQITSTVESVVKFLHNTLCYVQSQQLGVNDMTAMATETLQQLVDLGLVVQTRPHSNQGSKQEDVVTPDVYVLEVSPLGRAVFKGILFEFFNQSR